MVFDCDFFSHFLVCISFFYLFQPSLRVYGMSEENWFLISCKNSNCLWNKIMSLALIQADLLSPALFLSFGFSKYVFSSEITILAEAVDWMKEKKKRLLLIPMECQSKRYTHGTAHNCTVLAFITVFMSSSLCRQYCTVCTVFRVLLRWLLLTWALDRFSVCHTPWRMGHPKRDR